MGERHCCKTVPFLLKCCNLKGYKVVQRTGTDRIISIDCHKIEKTT